MTDQTSLLTLRGDDLRPLTDSEVRSFLLIVTLDLTNTVSDTPGDLTAYMDAAPEPKPFSLQVMVNRLVETGLQYSPLAVTAAARLCAGSPGIAVMWAYAFFLRSRDGNPLTYRELFSPELFGLGVPTDEALHRLWDAQKGNAQTPPDRNVDNVLDLPETWLVPANA